MTLASPVKGLAVLLALLIIAGLVGGIGSVELLIWLGFVAAWIAGWMVSRRKGEAAPSHLHPAGPAADATTSYATSARERP